MSQKDVILEKMNHVLDQLIHNAQQLMELSRRVIAEEEISPLQVQQEELLSELVELDNTFYQSDAQTTDEHLQPLQKQVDDKIEAFQRLNSAFLENVMNNQGLIQFKGLKPKKPD